MQDDEDGGGQIGRQQTGQLGQRLHAAGGCPDDDDIMTGLVPIVLCTSGTKFPWLSWS